MPYMLEYQMGDFVEFKFGSYFKQGYITGISMKFAFYTIEGWQTGHEYWVYPEDIISKRVPMRKPGKFKEDLVDAYDRAMRGI